MKRTLCILLTLLLCMSLSFAAFATDRFVPSIGYKDGPQIVEAEMNEEDITACLVVSSIKAAQEKTTDIHQDDRDLLLDVYKQLADNTMQLPLGEVSYVIRELVDVSFLASDCIDADHVHEEWLSKKGNTATVVFDLGVEETVEVTVLTYVDGKWIFAESVVNNGDGTVTCELEDICPVAFVLADGPVVQPVEDGSSAWVWVVVLALLLALLIVFLLLMKRRKDQEEKKK